MSSSSCNFCTDSVRLPWEEYTSPKNSGTIPLFCDTMDAKRGMHYGIMEITGYPPRPDGGDRQRRQDLPPARSGAGAVPPRLGAAGHHHPHHAPGLVSLCRNGSGAARGLCPHTLFPEPVEPAINT